jgi:hypothetical protein
MPGTTALAVRRVGPTLVCVLAFLTALSGCQADLPAGITARILLYGGATGPGGGMALHGAPAVGVTVTAAAANGVTRTALTDARGEATLLVPSGSYEVFSTYCGAEPARVLAMTQTATPVLLECAVP